MTASIQPRERERDMARAKINGFEMHYEVRGDGPPLLVAHGLMGNMRAAPELSVAFSRLTTQSPDDFRMVVYDARGHGESGYTTDPAGYSWLSLADDMYKLLLRLGIEKAHIVGGSMGAGTGICFALEHPQMVDRLVLIEPPPITDKDWATTRMIFGGLAALIESQGLEKAVEVALSLGLWSDIKESDPERYELLRAWLLSQNSAALVPAIRGLITDGPPLPEERFGEITAPTLIVTHVGDPIHPAESGVILNKAISGSRLITAPNSVYWDERPEEMLEAIKDFLQAG
jgi:pimeloyl-ACP methyl ester carboxylesterase